ncbi:MAG: hypothetical protein M1834_009718 [Cirrosporium novae-zelandiae]|nr:MAG: hypothetical protein M1834_009718 [Cirrosporium novae-zelandiae]
MSMQTSVLRSVFIPILIFSLIISTLHVFPSRQPFHDVERDVCTGFQGNSDLYGFGIRLGIYLQWISSLLANAFVPDMMPSALDTNSTFLFAIFIAIVKATTAHTLRQVEALRITILSNLDGLALKRWSEYLRHYRKEENIALENARDEFRALLVESSGQFPDKATTGLWIIGNKFLDNMLN